MANENRVVAYAGPARYQFMLPGLHRLAWAGFLVLHLVGGAYALGVLVFAWLFRLLLRLLAERSLFFQLTHLPWFIILVGLALVPV